MPSAPLFFKTKIDLEALDASSSLPCFVVPKSSMRGDRFIAWARDALVQGYELFPTAPWLRQRLSETKANVWRKASALRADVDLSMEPQRPPSYESLRPKYPFNRDFFPNLSVAFSKGLTLYLTTMPDDVASKLRLFLNDFFSLSCTFPDSLVIPALKEVSTWYKKGGSMLDRDWRAFVSLETVGGYRDPAEAPDLVAEAKEWVGRTIEYNPLMSTDRASRFKMLDELFALGRNQISTVLSIDEFIADPSLYCTAGSGRGLPRLHAEALEWRNGEWQAGEVRLDSSKWAGFLAMTPAQIKELLLKKVKQRNRMFIKPDEREKIRSITVQDPPTYLKMSFVHFYLRQLLADNPKIPLYQSATMRAESAGQFASSTTGSAFVRMPIDQTSMDHNVSLSLILDIIAYFMSRMPNAEARQVAGLIYYALDGGWLEVEVAGAVAAVIEILCGVLSGWEMTALINSLASYIQFTEIARAVKIRVASSEFFGDDVKAALMSTRDCVSLYAGYGAYGLTVNAKKFWISPDRDEFLRLVSERGVVRGYPARVITGLLWQRPRSQPQSGYAGLLQQSTSWLQLISRGGDPTKVAFHAAREVQRVLKVAPDVAEAILHTPKAFGGLGWYPYAARFCGVDLDAARTTAKFLSIHLPLLDGKLSPTQMTAYADEVLSATLTQAPTRARAFVIKTAPALRYVGRLRPLPDVTVFPLPRPPSPAWKQCSSIDKWLAVYKAKLKDDSGLLELSKNGPWTLQMRSRLGRRVWIDWLGGQIWNAPASVVNDNIVAPLASGVAALTWNRMYRQGFVRWQFMVEMLTSQELLVRYQRYGS